jgi:hypothetical protein
MCEISNDKLLGEELALRGGTALLSKITWDIILT